MTTTTHPAAAADLPEALRLADEIDPFTRKTAPDHLTSKVAADKLRRLHALTASAPAASTTEKSSEVAQEGAPAASSAAPSRNLDAAALVTIREMLERDPAACAGTAVKMIDAMLAAPQPPAAQPGAVLSIELTDDVRFILGFICFQCMHIVQALRLGGREINTKAEDEQAAAIHFMLNHYLADRENWRENVNAELRAMAAKGRAEGGKPA